MNGALANTKKKVDDQLLSFSEGVITWNIVQEMLDGKFMPEEEKAKSIQFVDYCNKVNERRYQREDYGYSVYYNAGLYIKQFDSFLKDYKKIQSLTLTQINKDIIDEYVGYKVSVKRYKTND